MAGEAQADNGGRLGMTTNDYTLVIGDKNFSSWSLRPWLALKACGIPFTEERVRLRQADLRPRSCGYASSGGPAEDEARSCLDSLAILEFLAERHFAHRLWAGG
jgi:glutathione S-transferase